MTAGADTEVAVIGAGPHGLAAAVHLRRAGVDIRVYGEPMGFWRGMPAGMRLRSNSTATNMIELNGPLSMATYHGELGEHHSHPFSLRHFVEYGLWVQRNGIPDVDRRTVMRLDRSGDSFDLELDGGDRQRARRVVVAAGIAAFAKRPRGFESLPDQLASHTSDHRDLARFAGKRVIVVGAGQSAFECAVLMYERGADVELVIRAPEVVWLRSWSPIHFLGPAGRIVYAPTDVGPLWYSRLVATPALFTRLPRDTQDRIAGRSIRPACSYFVKVRVDGIRLTLGTTVVAAVPDGGGVRLTLSDGTARVVDHLMFGTGYDVDIARYAFLAPELLAALRVDGGYPALSAGFESSISGLHIVGAPAARSFGPTMRFVSGSWYAGTHVAAAIAAPGRRRLDSRRLARAAAVVARDPVEGVERIREKLANESQRYFRAETSPPDPDWEKSLRGLLGIASPSEAVDGFDALWAEIVGSLTRRGLTVGRGSFSGWDDGDRGLVRAAWCITRNGQPRTVVETGVARGLTSRIVLEGLEANGAGRLWSIDLAPPLDRRRLAIETGAAVTEALKPRWTLIEGSSRRRLPALLDELGTIDLFIHDSRHTRRNISFELRRAWGALTPGGFMLVDDIHGNSAFDECVAAFGTPPAIVCASDDGRGRFGLIYKPA